MDPLLDFSHKVVLITGAAQGFGQLLAIELAQRGAKLVLGDVKDSALNTLAQQLSKEGSDVVAMHCDVSSNHDCKALVELGVSRFGQLDIAVNNAGIAHQWMAFHQLDESVIDQQFSVNVKGVQFGMRHQLNQMLKQESGAILNVSSIAGLHGAPKLSAYSAAKHAVIGLTKSAAVEYGRHNIRINAICPFFTLTKMVTDMADQQSQDFISQGSPMKRLGQPEEIVTMMVMMLSPANTYMTGQCVAIDGGVSAS